MVLMHCGSPLPDIDPQVSIPKKGLVVLMPESKVPVSANGASAVSIPKKGLVVLMLMAA